LTPSPCHLMSLHSTQAIAAAGVVLRQPGVYERGPSVPPIPLIVSTSAPRPESLTWRVPVSTLVRFLADNDEQILVEVDDDGDGLEQVGLGEAIVDAGRRLEEVFGSVRPALQTLSRMLREFGPEEHEIEFGMKLTLEAGAIVARTSSEANFVVKLRWKRDASE
jgi:Trypsin-co-occurring domain 1